MKNYTISIPENCACARLVGVNASFKDLSEVCGRIQGKKSTWAVDFLQLATNQEIPILFKRHNKKLGHRKELGGQKGRYPHKSAGFVLNALKSAIANGGVKELGTEYTILSACANKIQALPRMASKGRTARSYLELAKIEIVLKPDNIPPKKDAAKAETKSAKPAEVKSAIASGAVPESAPKKEQSEKKQEKKSEAKKTEAKEVKHEPKNAGDKKSSDHKKGDS